MRCATVWISRRLEMVQCTPGPLVTAASGTIGGTVMSMAPGGLRAAAWSKRCWRMSAEQQEIRRVMGVAALAWSGLSAADRLAWARLGACVSRRVASGARMPLSGYQAHARAWLAQIGLGTAIAPAVGNVPVGLLVPAAGLEVLEGAVYCTSLDIELGEASTYVLRVGRPTRPTVARLARELERYAIVSTTGRLDLYDARGEWRAVGADDIFLPLATALSGPATIACWVRMGPLQSGAMVRAVYRVVTPTMLVWRMATAWRGYWDGDDGSWTGLVDENAWHLIAHSIGAPGGRHRVWIDGVLRIDTLATSWSGTVGPIVVGSRAGYGDGMLGRFAWLQVSNIERGAAWVASAWAAGAGRPFPMDGNVTDQWRLADRSGAGWVNDVAGRSVGVRVGCTQVANKWAATCWPAGANRYGVGARGKIMAQWRPSGYFPMPAAETVYTFLT
jgi:hypothetical protein